MSTAPVIKTAGPVYSNLPVVPEDVDVTWLTNVLGHQVKTVEITKVVHGTASKVFAKVVYNDEHASATSKATFLCIKGGFDPNIIAQYPSV